MIVQSHPPAADAWLIVVAPTSLLALPASESDRVPNLTARLTSADGFRSALESLVGDGIANAPDFALLDGDAVVLRVVLRGDAAATANVGASGVTFSGSGMATWTERVLEGAASLQLTVPGSTWTVQLEAGGPSVLPPAWTSAENTLVPEPPHQDASDREPEADSDSEAYDFLFGSTIYRTHAGASIRIPNPDPQRPGNHDGQTMLARDLELSVATELAPVLHLERADGSRESLSRPLLVGRSPEASGSGQEPRLLTISDDPDISRTHLRVAVEGDTVVVTDLGSKNGTFITLPGAAPRKLRASEPTVLLPGTLIDLGGGTAFTVRES